jgi:hypothetical protein|tara:strand:- start:268 stop:612 length:345 start_codon:yes stop_codon:yes gene_type:complete
MSKINLSIDDGEAFFAHELSTNFNPTQFVLDFKNVTPRVDARSKDAPVLRIKHNVVIVEPFHMKKIVEFLEKRIKAYEKTFGEIEKPKAIQIYEKKQKKSGGKEEKVKTPSYFG